MSVPVSVRPAKEKQRAEEIGKEESGRNERESDGFGARAHIKIKKQTVRYIWVYFLYFV